MDILDYLSKEDISLYVINLNRYIYKNIQGEFLEILHDITDFQSDIVKFRTRIGLENYSKEGKI